MEMILPRLSADDAVIDVGCGNGRLAAVLAPKVRAVYGLDYSEDLIDAARKTNPEILFYSGDANYFDTWSSLPLFNTVVSNVAIRKDGCKLNHILPIVNRLARRPTRCFFRIQGERDLPGWLVAPPLYNEEEIRHHFAVAGWDLEIAEETYLQKFTDGAYFRTFLERIGVTAHSEMFQRANWPLRVLRQYYCVSATVHEKE